MAWDWALEFDPVATEGLALDLPGASGDYASTPDSAAVSVTGDLDIRAHVALDDWTPASNNMLVAKFFETGYERSYFLAWLTNSGLQLLWSSDGAGTGQQNANSTGLITTATGLSSGDIHIRATLDVDDGAAGRIVQFFWSLDGVTWTQLGADVTGAATSIADTDSLLTIGAGRNTGSLYPATGEVYSAQVYDGIDGTLAADFNPTRDATLGASTVTSSTTGEVWTINGSAAIIDSDVIPNNSRPPVPVTDILGASVNYGKTGEALQYSGGTMTLAIDNASSAYTPGGGGTYTTARFLGVPVKLYANVTGVGAPTWTHGPPAVFTGVVTDVSWSFDSAFQSTMTVQVSDMLTMLGTLSFVDVDSGNGLDITAGTAAAALTATLVAANAVTSQVTQTTILNPSGDAGPGLLAVTDYIGSAGALAQTVERSDGGDVYVRHGLPVDATNAYNALTFRTRGQQPISGALGTLYLDLPGASGDYASTPDSAAVSITGDIDIRCYVALDDWTPAANSMLVAKFNEAFNKESFFLDILTSSGLQFLWSEDGLVTQTATSSVTLDASAADTSAGAALHLRATMDVDDGASNSAVRFYWSNDGVVWSQLGVTRTSGSVTSIYDSAALLTLGAGRDSGSLFPLSGDMYSAQLYDGIDGTLAADFDPTRDASAGDTTFTSSTTGEVWTVNGNASIDSTIVGLYPLNLWDTSLTPAGDEPHNFARIDFASGAAIAYSQATYTSDGGTAQTAQVPDVNLNEFGARSITRTGLLALNDAATLGLAEHFLQQYGVETIAPLATRGVELPPIVTGDNDGYELVKYSVGDTCTINFRPANASATITIVGVVAGISWSITPAAASLVVRLEDGDQTVGFILDSDAFGRLDINRL
jgi:hypothetical protein